MADALDPVLEGNYMSYLNAYPGFGTISQSIPTIIGQSYELEFWVSSNGGQGNLYSEFGGMTLFNEANPSVGILSYTPFRFNVVATSISSEFLFGGSGLTGTYFLENASLAAIPEPSTYAVVTGMILVAIIGLKRFYRWDRGGLYAGENNADG